MSDPSDHRSAGLKLFSLGVYTDMISKAVKNKQFYFVAFSLLIITLTVLSITKTRQLLSRASLLPNYLETEKGTLVGNVSVKTDPAASGGQYIEFNPDAPVNLSFQPTAPYYSTFYYMWYLNTNTDGTWSYWPDHGNTPPATWFSHYIPDPEVNVFDPANELYSSNDYNNFKWQVQKMADAHLEVAIASWWGQNRKEDTAFNSIITNFMARSDNPYPNLRWSIFYEPEFSSDPGASAIANDLNYFKSKFTGSPYFLKINGKPVIFVYAGTTDTTGMNQRWSDANALTGNSFYIVLKVYSGYQTSVPQPDSWHQYAPAVRSGQHSSFSYYVSPGFWLDDGSAERLPRDSQVFETAVKSMVTANTTWKLVETWNEWGEGSSVEPGEKVVVDSTGKEVIDNSASPSYNFANLYIDILGRNLPPLEAGTGR